MTFGKRVGVIMAESMTEEGVVVATSVGAEGSVAIEVWRAWYSM